MESGCCNAPASSHILTNLFLENHCLKASYYLLLTEQSQPFIVHFNLSPLSSWQNHTYTPAVPFLDRPWSYRGHGRHRLWQLRLVQSSRHSAHDSQTLPQLECPLRRPYLCHQSIHPDAIPANLSDSYNATSYMAPLRDSTAIALLGCVCLHFHL